MVYEKVKQMIHERGKNKKRKITPKSKRRKGKCREEHNVAQEEE